MTTMMAMRALARGGPDQLVYEAVPRPDPARDEVLVAVHAAAITFTELTWDETWRHAPPIPSHEMSGVVAGVGADVTSFRAGDEVYALIGFDRQGAAADFVTVPAAHLAFRPRTVSHIEAAALPLAALTAWQALVEHAKLVSGERVLVLGGAGGVGGFAVQLARGFGADVTATAFARDVATVLALGARRVIEVEAEQFDDDPPYDVVIDTVGGATLDRAFALARGGRLVTLHAPPSADLAAQYDVAAVFFIVAPDPDALGQLAALVDRGELSIRIASTFPLAKGRAAFESGRTLDRPPGKTVLVVRQ